MNTQQHTDTVPKVRPNIHNVLAPLDVKYLDVTSLAWLTHEAEYLNDDLTFIWIQNEMQVRGELETRLYHDEYKRLWPEHAEARGYARRGNHEH